MGILYSHQFKNKYVFDNSADNLSLKAVELYKRLGVDKMNDRYNLSLQYHYANMDREALTELDHILSMPIEKEDKVVIYETYGDVLLSLARVNESKDAYVKSIDYGNCTPKIYRRLGELYSSFKEYPQAIYYHNKALEVYFSYEWRDLEEPFNDDDFLYFTNYYSLASAYFAIKDYQKAIENGHKLIEHYGGYDKIVERYFTTINIEGDSFIPQLIPSTYEILALSHKELCHYDKAREHIVIARVFDPKNVDIAKLEGFIEGKLDYNGEENIIREILRRLDYNNDLLIKLQSVKEGDFIMGNKYEVHNDGEIGNLAMGDNASININNQTASEIKSVLYEIRDGLTDSETEREIENIVVDIENNKFNGIKQQLSNLLVGVSAGLIANNLPGLVVKLSEIIAKL
jgi:tetratricopeptide (TPR) repeat protein